MKFLKKSTLRSSQVSLNRCCIESLFLSKISRVEYHPLWRNSSIPGNHWTSYWLPVENFSATLSNFHPTGIFRQRDDSLFHWNLSVSLEELFHVREKSKLNQISPYDPFPLENVPSISIFWIFIYPLIRQSTINLAL